MANRYRDVADQTTNQTPDAPAGTVTPPKPPSRWILGRWSDLALFVCTPLLILPLFYSIAQVMSAEDIALYVLAFGAVGHHLPGMLRAYGDKELFQRFKARFVIAPIFLLLVCVGFTLTDLTAITLLVYLWGAWHGLMQTFGFVRIYDAKAKVFDPWTKRLDWHMCFWWIVSGMLLSPNRSFQLLKLYHLQCGAPLPPGWALVGIQIGAAAITGVVTILFFANHFNRIRKGMPVSWIKVLLLATSIAFWWFANFAVQNMIVGIALFEVFHDVQYLSIVWVFNRGRVQKASAGVGAFTRFVFRRSGALIGMYVGICFAYGSLRLIEKELTHVTMRDFLTGLLAASTLLHFYYDGFIWKVREQKTGEALDIQAQTEGSGRRLAVPSWLVHGAKWSLLVIPLVILGLREASAEQSKSIGQDNFRRLQNLDREVPNHRHVKAELGDAYTKMGMHEEAAAAYDEAIDLGLRSAVAHVRLGNAYLRSGDLVTARAEYQRALDLNPTADKKAATLAAIAGSYRAEGRLEEANDYLQQALDAYTKSPGANDELGRMRELEGDLEGAEEAYARAVALDPDDANRVSARLGSVRLRLGDAAGAVDPLTAAAERQPSRAKIHHELGSALLALERFEEAAAAFQRAIILKSDSAASMVNLGSAYLRLDRPDAAAEVLERAIGQRDDLAAAHYLLGAAREAQDRRDDAIAAYRAALERNPNLAPAKERLEVLAGDG